MIIPGKIDINPIVTVRNLAPSDQLPGLKFHIIKLKIKYVSIIPSNGNIK